MSAVLFSWVSVFWNGSPNRPHSTGENLDAVTAVTDSFTMADAFTGDRTGGTVAQTSAQTVDISVRQGIVWVYRL